MSEYSPDQLEKSWKWVLHALEKPSCSSSIPVVTFEDISSGAVTEKQIADAKLAGCFVVKDVIPTEEATSLNSTLQTYLKENKTLITGWPREKPYIKELYWTEAQVRLRSHPNQLHLQRWLNELWTEGPEAEPLTYADALRSVPPGSTYSALGPHVDAGSLSRWCDGTYRGYYGAVFGGDAEHLDLYRLKDRQDCRQNAIEGPAHSSVLRTFQGWTCLTPVGKDRGGIYFYPGAALTISYILLRPFFREVKPVEDFATEAEYLAADNWKFNPDTEYFPGSLSISSQHLGVKSHPHLRFKSRLVSIPDLNPGDTVWWHCDGIHAVEPNHAVNSEDPETLPAVVVYIPAVPTTPGNCDYVKRQAECYKEGRCPPDFAQANAETHGSPTHWMSGGEKAMLL